MNPTEAYPAEVVALQDTSYGWFPGQPGGPRVVQHTTVNIPLKPQNDHLIWSLCNFVYGNIFCLGLAALISSVKARDRKVFGDLAGARHHASSARILNIVATVLTTLSVFITIIVLVLIVRNVQASYYSHYYYN
ncbi:dispanin subfamily A member 2b-like [Girardinichthys multiradiatus]|uniref:dispanin subfamily A member 2b-like n=1 Tax=Girardinichthys multiradiatus TaxID=208333 RepID=UPI001FAD1F34|nr:dispanin subfamily A member 2b-like [Girardinichthys multiradiatus]